jgi:hypothetical protein
MLARTAAQDYPLMKLQMGGTVAMAQIWQWA